MNANLTWYLVGHAYRVSILEPIILLIYTSARRLCVLYKNSKK